jgi:hypothetical protein
MYLSSGGSVLMNKLMIALAICLIALCLGTAPAGAEMTEGGLFDVKVKTKAWGGFKKGNNIIFIHIRDANGKAVEGATIGILPWMPEMDHGTPYTSKITDLGGGKYRTNVPLTMGGLWEITFTITAGDKTDSIKLRYPKVKKK